MTDPVAMTDFQQAYAVLSGALETTRSELARVEGEIDRLELKRDEIGRALPHTDDIVMMFRRGLADVTRTYEGQLREYLTEGFAPSRLGASASDAAGTAAGRGPDFLAVGVDAADRAIIRERPDGRPPAKPLNLAAVTYFLRDRIEAELPDLVARLCPDASKGMKAADRQAALDAVNAELRDLAAKQQQLIADINAARKMVQGG